ncbi:hypothetical protein TNCV_1110571 [Trichonephila clavipes]|nr:hypothetical protein TNCV_1110571 [Trichonephila clavipes]
MTRTTPELEPPTSRHWEGISSSIRYNGNLSFCHLAPSSEGKIDRMARESFENLNALVEGMNEIKFGRKNAGQWKISAINQELPTLSC